MILQPAHTQYKDHSRHRLMPNMPLDVVPVLCARDLCTLISWSFVWWGICHRPKRNIKNNAALRQIKPYRIRHGKKSDGFRKIMKLVLCLKPARHVRWSSYHIFNPLRAVTTITPTNDHYFPILNCFVQLNIYSYAKFAVNYFCGLNWWSVDNG